MELSKRALVQRDCIFEQFKKYAPEFKPTRSTPLGQTDYRVTDIDPRTIRSINIHNDASAYSYRVLGDDLPSKIEDNTTYRVIANNHTSEDFRRIISDLHAKTISDPDMTSSVFGLIKFVYDDNKIPVNVKYPGHGMNTWTIYRSREYRNRPMDIPHEDIEFIDLVVVSNSALFQERSKDIEQLATSMEVNTSSTEFNSDLI